MEIPSSKIYGDGTNIWIVPSSTDRFLSHKVKPINFKNGCDMVCKGCGHCKHGFKCDCTVLKFGTNSFCKHIHAVCHTFFHGDKDIPKAEQLEPMDTATKPESMETSVIETMDTSDSGQLETTSPVDCSTNADGYSSTGLRSWLSHFANNFEDMVAHLSENGRTKFSKRFNERFLPIPARLALCSSH